MLMRSVGGTSPISKSSAHLIALAVLTLSAACGGPGPLPREETPSPAPTVRPTATLTPTPTSEPKRLTVCLREEPDSLYPYGTDSAAARHVWEALYDGPLDERGYQYQPVILTEVPTLGREARIATTAVETGDRVLAASGSVMELAPGVRVETAAGERVTFQGQPLTLTQMVVTFTLRSGLRWSDGERLTADDSVYGFEIAGSAGTPTEKHVVERTANYQAVNERQVVWEGVPGFVDRGYFLTFWHPLPRHAWKGLSAAELVTGEASTRHPLGWGPFAIRAWVPGESIRVERNPHYFRGSEGLPRLDEVTFRFITDPEALGQALMDGTCDVVTHEASGTLDVEALRSAPGVTAHRTQDSAWELMAFGISPAPGHSRPDFFEDVRVRRGIAHCIDRQALANEAFPDGGRVLHTYLPPDHPTYGPAVQPTEELAVWGYQPEAGKGLLAAAGWYDEDGDGIREAHDIPGVVEGTPYRLLYRTTDDPLRILTATRVKADLRACGIEVLVQKEAPETLFAPGPEGALFGRRFDLAQFSWPVLSEPLCDAFLSSQIPDRGDWGRPNVAGFIDGAYDEACLKAMEGLPGDPDHAAKHAAPQRIFSERLPVLPLFQHQKVTLARSWVIGLALNPSEPSELWNVEEIDLQW